MGVVKHSQSSQNSNFSMSLQYLEKEVRDEVDFLDADKHQSFYKLISALWVSNFPTRWYYHYWSAWSSVLKVLKVTSLQYLYNNSKKGRNEIHFLHADKHQNFYKLDYRFWSK